MWNNSHWNNTLTQTNTHLDPYTYTYEYEYILGKKFKSLETNKKEIVFPFFCWLHAHRLCQAEEKTQSKACKNQIYTSRFCTHKTKATELFYFIYE